MRTLVFGGTGIVGRALVREARRRGWAAFGPSHGQAEITDAARVESAVRSFRPQLIVNCAAFTKVDLCESEPERAHAVNGAAVENLVRAARSSGARLVHLSTDYVFDGRAETPYPEEHPTAPQSVYGASKLAGEERALSYEQALVVRTSWIFGEGGANFVDTIAGRIRAGQRQFQVVSDQLGAPTWAPFLARAVADLGECAATGLMHYQNRPAVTWFDFAREIARRLDTGVSVEPIPTSEAPRPAPRPAYSVLAIDQFEKWAGRPVESWHEGLATHLGA